MTWKDVPKSDYNRLNRHALQGFEDSQRVGAVRKVFREWSACMKKDRFRYPSPLDAANDPRWGKSPTPTVEETEAAEADVRCKRETDLVAVWAAAETKLQQDLIKADAEVFRALKETRRTHLAAARRVLAAGR